MSTEIKRTDAKWNTEHHYEVARLLAGKGFTSHLENGEIVRLDWKNKEADREFVQFLISALSSIKFDLERSIFEQLEEVHFFQALHIYLNGTNTTFENLKSREIAVSKAHQGTTPYEHIVNVVGKLEIGKFIRFFEGDEAQQGFIIQSIIDAIAHDWGKIVTAQGDVHQYHAEISALIATELGFFDEKQIAAIRFHHIFQLVDFEQVTKEEVKELFPDSTSFAMLSVLASADVASVKTYEAFALGGILDIIRCMNEELITSTQGVNLLELFQKQIVRFFEYAQHDLLKRREYIQVKIEQIKVFVTESGTNLNENATSLIELIIKTIDDNLQAEASV